MLARASCALRTLRPAILALTSLFAVPSVATPFPQVVDAAYGALSGRVTDVSEGTLPGVVVTLSSPSLMAPRAAITARDGHYLVPALPPGDYTLTFSLSGFGALTANARVRAGSTTSVDARLEIATVAVATTVEPTARVIDRRRAAIEQAFTQDQLGTLPGSRSMFAILSSTPGIQVARFEVGGNTGDAGGPYSAYGTSGANRPMVEGINVVQLNQLGFTLDYGAFEQVTVGLAAHGPEWPVPGVYVQFVGKSGGNRYRGTFYGDLEQRGWQSHNIDAAQQRRASTAGIGSLSPDANRLWSAHDLNTDLGGYVVRDRAWWYGSFRDQDIELRQLNFPVGPSETRLRNYTGKVTGRAGSQKFIGFVQAARNHQPNRLDPFGPAGSDLQAATAIHNSVDATSQLRVSGAVWKAEWNAIFGERLFLEARGGQFHVLRTLLPNGNAPRFEDIDTLLVAGGGRHSARRLRRGEAHASLSYFRDGWAGSHQVKAGADLLHSVTADRVLASFPGDVLHVTRGGQPAEVYRFLAPSASASGLMAGAAYVVDTWRMTDRLTVNPGIRFDRYRVFLPAQAPPTGAEGQPITFPPVDRVVAWNRMAPRISAVFDAFGTGKAFVKVSYGRYCMAPGDLGPAASSNAAEWWLRYPWQDLNGNGIWDAGEEGALRDSRGGRAAQSIDPDLRAPWVDEATVFLEGEARSAIGIRTGVVWRREAGDYARQNLARPFAAFSVPVVIPDPGPDGLPGTSDDGPGLPGYDLRLDQTGVNAKSLNVIRNVSGPDSRYVTWEAGAERRMRRWSLSAGLSHTWSLEQGNEYRGQVVRQNPFVLTPNDLINTADGGRHRFRTWTATAWGTFRGPWHVLVTPLLRHQSGQPFGRTISASMNYGVVKMLAEPIGTRRTDNVTLVDLRLQREFRRSGSRTLSIFLDAFNLLNANPAQDVNWASGSSFLAPLTVVAPRIARVGVRAAF